MAFSRRRVLLIGLAGLVAIPIVAFQVFQAETASGQRRIGRNSTNTDKYDPQVVVPAFPAIEKPRAASAAEANNQLRPHDLVLGITLNGKSRAYPINQLTGPSREIFNDSMGGQPIAATW